MGSLRTLKRAAILGIGVSNRSDLCIRLDNQPNAIYLIDRGYLRHVPDRETLYNLYGEGYLPKDIKHELFPDLPFGRPLASGTYLAFGSTSYIYLIMPGFYIVRPVSKEAMVKYGFSLENIRTIKTETFDRCLMGDLLRP